MPVTLQATATFIMAMQNKHQHSSEKTNITPKRIFAVTTLWLSIGAFIGFVVAGEMEIVPESWAPFVIAGAFVMAFTRCGISVKDLVSNTDQLMQRAQPGNLSGQRALARVGKLQEAGITVSEFNHLFIFTLTVFPQMGSPYETTIRQFITLGELPNFYTGRFVVFAEDAENPGYGFIDKEPSEYWQQKAMEPPAAWKTYKADTVYPDQKINENMFGDEPPKMTPLRWAINLVVVPACLVLGFLLPFAIAPEGMAFIKDFLA